MSKNVHYYNEWEPNAAAWLRNLIAAGLLPDGYVDERSITDVQPEDLMGYTQVHFFAGIGGWPLALQLAGWPTTEPVWTGSCPCQPFSTAGRGAGTEDSRHLWPQFQRLIAVCKPPIVFGEQVASRAGRGWLAGVRTDLEAMDYAVGAADLCAASVGAPHIRQRLWWVADAGHFERGRWDALRGAEPSDAGPAHADEEGDSSGRGASRVGQVDGSPDGSAGSGVADSQRSGRMDATLRNGEHDAEGRPQWDAPLDQREPSQGRSYESPWADSISIPCLDGKSRRVESGVAPLAERFPRRVEQLRAYGNAIVPQVAAEFIKAFVAR